MHQSQIILAYKSLAKLSRQDIPIRDACRLHRLSQALKPVWDFQAQEEGKLIEKLNPTLSDGTVTFKTEQDAQEYASRLKELAEMEVDDIVYTPVTMPIPDGVTMSVRDVEALDGFVTFTDEE